MGTLGGLYGVALVATTIKLVITGTSGMLFDGATFSELLLALRASVNVITNSFPARSAPLLRIGGLYVLPFRARARRRAPIFNR